MRNLSYGWKTLEASKEIFQLPHKPAIQPTQKILVCNLTLSGYMPDHLDTLSYYVRYIGTCMNIPLSHASPEPKLEKWHMNKGPFAHGKTLNVFEKKTYHRLIQAFDTHPDTVQDWIQTIHDTLPYGVDLKVEKFDFYPKGFGKSITLSEAERPMNHQELVQKKAEEYLAKFNSKKK